MIRALVRKIRRLIGQKQRPVKAGALKPKKDGIKSNRFTGSDIAADIAQKYGPGGDLLALFAEKKGKVVHKWHHYIPIYERYFAPWRNRPVRFLEIGVSKGGSLQMWREYFGDKAVIYGIDIDPDCAAYDGDAGQVRIGSQVDEEFLAKVLDEMGGADIILDDGSHQMGHVSKTLRLLWPRLSVGGIFMIEDLHTAYWKNHGGGLDHPANFFNHLKLMADDMHAPYHDGAPRIPETAGELGAVHMYDSIVVLEKAVVYPPVHSKVGG
jgi:hypothetical protein